MNMARLSWTMRGEKKGEEERGTRCSSQEAKGTEEGDGNQNVWIIWERASVGRAVRPWAGKFRVEGWVCQVGTEGFWENLRARSTLIS